MSIFTDVVSTFSKSVLSKILLYLFLFLCFAYIASGIGNWLSEKFTTEPTKAELTVQNAQQDAVIDAQASALEKKDETIEMAKDLTTAAIRSMEDYSQDKVKGVTKTAELQANLANASNVNKAEIVKITHTEKDEAIKAEKIRLADQRLAETQDLEIEAAYQAAMQRSHF